MNGFLKVFFYAEYCRRTTSFDNWPKQMRPSPKDLVESGFFIKVMETL